ncbi:MAG: DUF4912 domain-containing protein [Candidatus Omnitrophica bacterium]|nr:DUF4912 domain-containing protein [Candidatus Omnitrophota bacterium]
MAKISKAKKKLKTKAKIKISKKKKIVKPVSAYESKKDLLSRQEVAVGVEKFSHAKSMVMQDYSRKELPSGYGRDTMVLAVRDPWWLYTYWEVKGSTWDKFKSELKEEFYRAKRVLRVYDVSSIIFNGSNANSFFDILIREDSMSWYIDIGSPGKSWCVDLGLLLSNGRFVTVLRSNVVETPLDGPSWITDEEWMIPDDMFARLYGMGFGLGRSSPAGGVWRKGIVTSAGVTSMASPVKKQAPKGFWLEVNCELIVYGATEPDAKVTVQDKVVPLRRDGTFTLRFALPDGKQVIPVKAVSRDGLDKRTITPIVERETK